ncbi:MAG: alpha/beta hydrolase [Anaerolineae bacterium]|nr:alpha/beta hydrolase [Anaerolineae bacterium]
MLRLINKFVYRPEATVAEENFTPADLGLSYEAVSIKTGDNLLLSAWYFPANNPTHILMYCHGNAGDIRDWSYAMPPFLEMGCSVLLFDYRGYGQSQGKPSESGLYLDGESVWGWVEEKAEEEGITAVILGKSLGSAIAIHVASQTPPGSLILDSAFTSMREIALTVTPWLPDAMLPELYESLKIAPKLTCPTLVIHGRNDTLVPLAHGQALYNAMTCPKTLTIIDGADHNNLSNYPDYYAAIQAFLHKTA